MATFTDGMFAAADDGRHEGSIEEWVFTAWTADGGLGVVSGHRIVGRTAWYWAALARAGRPLLHITDFDVPVRADPFIVKGEQLWAEHTCDAPLEQWSIGNETYASAIDHVDDALGLGYGTPTPIAFDMEWYAVAPVWPLSDDGRAVEAGGREGGGYGQDGVVHGTIEILGEPPVELVEQPGRRWHRWTGTGVAGSSRPADLGRLTLPEAVAHTGVRAPFAFPDGSVDDLVLTPTGWVRRAPR